MDTTLHIRPHSVAAPGNAAPTDGPRCAVIFLASVYDWLYRAMIPLLREKYRTRFVFLTRGSDLLKQRYGDLLTEDDVAIDMAAVEAAALAAGDPAESVFALAREFERKYGLLYMRDVLQQERSVATRFLNNSPFHAHGREYGTELSDLTRQINAYFSLFERTFEDRNVDLVFSRPDSLVGVPLTAVAQSREVLCTFPDVAKYKDLITWSFGAYRGDQFLRTAYDSLPDDAVSSTESADAVRYADRDFVQPESVSRPLTIATRLIKVLLIRSIMLLEDIRDWKFGRRTSFRTELGRLFNTYCAGRWLEQRSKATTFQDKQFPFVLFLLPVEPEFNTHSLAREFNNSLTIAQQLALSIPAGYRLVIKEHGSNIGNRRIEYYEHLESLPNVEFAAHWLPGTMLAAHADAIATISGTIGMEASLLGKQVITFTPRTIYGFLPNVQVVTSFYDLPSALAKALAPRTEAEIAAIKKAGARFYQAIREIGFPAPGAPLFKGTQTKLTPATTRRAFDILLQVYAMHRSAPALRADKIATSVASE
jgi:hypothetical protein